MERSVSVINEIPMNLGQSGFSTVSVGGGDGAGLSQLTDQIARLVETAAFPAPKGGDEVAKWRSALTSDVQSDLLFRAAASQNGQGVSMNGINGSKDDFHADSTSSASEATIDGLAERIKSLYVEMTVLTVNWKVAQKVQQDTTHILRGQ